MYRRRYHTRDNVNKSGDEEAETESKSKEITSKRIPLKQIPAYFMHEQPENGNRFAYFDTYTFRRGIGCRAEESKGDGRR